MKQFFIITCASILLFSACKSKQNATDETKCDSCKEAMVLFFGDTALDGCGWVVEVASEIYMPKNLPSEFQKDSLPVSIKFQEQGRANCGLIKDKYPAMNIEEMYKQ